MRYADAGTLLEPRREDRLEAQRASCIPAARVEQDPRDRSLRDRETETREHADSIFIDLLMKDRANTSP
jgi:hypothetical protein